MAAGSRAAVRRVLCGAALAAACSGDASGSSGATGTDGGAGAPADGGSRDSGTDSGGSSMGGSGAITPRTCGDDARCNAGATCRVGYWETAIECDCDPSGHFLCVLAPGGGAGPSFVCSEGETCPLNGGAAAGNSCSTSNTFCTRQCTCGDGGMLSCTETCDGAGVEAEADGNCARSSCQTDITSNEPYWSSCTYRDGDCSYSIECGGDDTGVCAP